MTELKIITPEMQKMLEFIEKDLGLDEYEQLEHMKKQGLRYLVLSARLELPKDHGYSGGYRINYYDFDERGAKVRFVDLDEYKYFQQGGIRANLGWVANQCNFLPDTVKINGEIYRSKFDTISCQLGLLHAALRRGYNLVETEDERRKKFLVDLWGSCVHDRAYFNLFKIGEEITTVNLWPKKWMNDERLEALTKKYGGDLEQIRKYLEPDNSDEDSKK